MTDLPSAARVYRRLLGWLDGRRGVMALAIAAVALDAAGQALFVYLLRPLIDNTLASDGAGFGLGLPLLVLCAVVLRVSGNFGGMYGMEWIGRGLVHDLRRALFQRYLVLPLAEFGREAGGASISRLTYDTEQVAQAVTTALIGVIRDLLIVGALLAVMLFQSWRLTLALVLLVPVVGVIVFIISRRFRRIASAIQQSMGGLTQRAAQAVEGQEVIRVYDGRACEVDKFEQVNRENRRLHLKLKFTQLLSSSMIQLAAGLAVVILLLVAATELMREQISPGIFMSVLGAMVATIPPLKRLTNVHVLLQKGVAAADSIFAVLDRPAEVDTGTHAPARVEGRVRFEQVDFRYPDAAAGALHGIDLELAPGTVTAVVGRSGSGKTTLARLLPRLYRPGAGRILLDGVALEDYALDALRRQIALVGQHTVLLDGTIADNIRYGALVEASDEQVRAAAEDAWAMAFIDRLPDGLDTVIGEGGGQLSGGQRQRIAIARALLKNAPLLVLDEATSALDAESEQLVQKGLEKLMRDRTTLVIAHRLTTVERADQVIVLDEGRIVERGTHKSLIDAPGSLYSHLYRSQFRSIDGA
ncbi:MAG: lipid A export permease/ATP-binding protein MsbA [Wenzhouxiangellaceae bacterium]|nr:lipid A export permease/ATP-binding protein MsbA [Wenzhouxiangellaceae bacterium]